MPKFHSPRGVLHGLAYAYFFLVMTGVISVVSLCHASEPHYPFPVHWKYQISSIMPNHLSRDKQDNLVRKAYEEWKKRYLIPVSTENKTHPLYRISAGKSKRKKTLSEGQGYGMMLSVYMAGYDPDAQKIFNGLWLYSRQHPSPTEKRFMVYQVPVSRNRQSSAFDGDCDIAYALFLADAQWGSDGLIKYRKEALEVTEALLKRVIGSKSNLPMLGDWVSENGKRYNQYSVRSSDLMPTHFKLFFHSTGDTRWRSVASQSQSLIEQMQAKYSNHTGLLPDFIIRAGGNPISYKPAPPFYLEGIYDGKYYYNAARVPWRVGADALLNQDQVSAAQVQRIAKWVLGESKGFPQNIRPGYKLDGRPLSNDNYLSKAFIAPLGVAMMTLPAGQDFVNRVFDLCVELKQDYFEDTLGLQCLLLMTGNCWIPS